MSKATKRVKQYLSDTNTLIYSYLISLPLLLLYEVLIFISQPNSDHIVRISVDVWVKTLFSYFGQNVLSITLILVALTGIIILYRDRSKLSSLRISYFGGILLEALVYAFLLSLLITSLVGNLLQLTPPDSIESLTLLQQLALSLGAGLYAELFFCVILVSVLLWLFKYFFSKKAAAFTAAIIFAAVIFSLVHYTGALGDTFTIRSCLFRFLFGLALNMIYLWRGLGTAAWTHAIYDLMILAF